RAIRSARPESSLATSSCASASAMSTLGPAELARAIPASGATYTAITRARCLRASPAAYEAARRPVTESSTPTRIAEGPSVPSSNSPCSTGKVYGPAPPAALPVPAGGNAEVKQPRLPGRRLGPRAWQPEDRGEGGRVRRGQLGVRARQARGQLGEARV